VTSLLFLGSFGAVYVNDSLPPCCDTRSIPNRDANFDLTKTRFVTFVVFSRSSIYTNAKFKYNF